MTDIEKIEQRAIEISDQLDAEGFSYAEQVAILGGSMVCALMALSPADREQCLAGHIAALRATSAALGDAPPWRTRQ